MSRMNTMKTHLRALWNVDAGQRTHNSIADLLGTFARRRLRLIVQRGICAAVVTLLIVMSLVALADAVFFLAEPTRWTLTAVGYAAVGLAFWITCLRLLLRVPSAATLARLVETAEPSLREDLVSAVELGDWDTANPWDSDEFRHLLQEDVGRRTTGASARRLLPVSLIRGWIIGSLTSIGVAAALLLVPGLHFGQRMARALAPMAGVDRVSLTKIELVDPPSGNVAVPVGEVVEVVVQLSGRPAQRAFLDVFRAGGERQRTKMTRTEHAQQFRAEIHVGQESLRYRVRAGDSQTDRFAVTARPRPQVLSFAKTYTSPGYLGLPIRTEEQDSGDLEAVEGTKVALTIEASELISVGFLEVVQAQNRVRIPLTPVLGADGRPSPKLTGMIELHHSGSYHVHLTAAATGFTNKFNPEYAIRVLPDKAPVARILEPGSAIVAPPTEIISVRGRAEDDWGLAAVEQQVKLKDGPWRMVARHKVAGTVPQKTTSVALDWDLQAHRVVPGDEIHTRLVAIDRQGNLGESQIVRVVISAYNFRPQHVRFLSHLQRMARLLAEQKKSMSSISRDLEALNQQGEQAALTNKPQLFASRLAALGRGVDNIRAEAVNTIRLSSSAASSRDLVLVARMLARIQAATDSAKEQLLAVAASTDTMRKQNLDRADELAASAKDHTQLLADSFAELVADQSLVVAEQVLRAAEHGLTRSLRLAETSDEPVHRKRMARKIQVVEAHLKALHAVVKEAESSDVADELQQLIHLSARVTNENDDHSDLARELQTKLLAAIGGRLVDTKDALPQTRDIRRALMSSTSRVADQLQLVGRSGGKINEAKKKLGQRAEQGAFEEVQRLAAQTRQQRNEVKTALRDALYQLQAIGDAQAARPQQDHAFVSDVAHLRSTNCCLAAAQDPVGGCRGCPCFAAM